jgi:hypothetical protein
MHRSVIITCPFIYSVLISELLDDFAGEQSHAKYYSNIVYLLVKYMGLTAYTFYLVTN